MDDVEKAFDTIKTGISHKRCKFCNVKMHAPKKEDARWIVRHKPNFHIEYTTLISRDPVTGAWHHNYCPIMDKYY